jgi:hypothetical protein
MAALFGVGLWALRLDFMGTDRGMDRGFIRAMRAWYGDEFD